MGMLWSYGRLQFCRSLVQCNLAAAFIRLDHRAVRLERGQHYMRVMRHLYISPRFSELLLACKRAPEPQSLFHDKFA